MMNKASSKLYFIRSMFFLIIILFLFLLQNILYKSHNSLLYSPYFIIIIIYAGLLGFIYKLRYLDVKFTSLFSITLLISIALAFNYPGKMNDVGDALGLNVCPLPSGPKETIRELITTATVTRSPLVIDLDGDGVETTSVGNGVYFDHDSNGFAEDTGWAGKDDGLLVRDLNGNGEIEDGAELFGNNSVLSNGQKASNGFEALKDLDSNHDGKFSNLDAAWNSVKVWKDANGNGLEYFMDAA